MPWRCSVHLPPADSRAHRVTDQCSLRFLEFYVRQIEPASAVQLWNRSLAFVRDILANQATSRTLMFPATRYVDTSTKRKM